MTDPEQVAVPDAANPPPPAAGPGPISHEKRVKQLRRELYRQPETIAAHALMAISAATLALIGAPLLLIIVLAGFGSCLVVLTVMSGSHAMVNLTLGYFVVLLLVWLVDVGAGAAIIALVMSLVLIMSDLFRLNFARRRSAKVDARLFITTLGFSLIVAVVSTLSIAVGDLITGDTQRSWVWVPITTVPIILLISIGAIAIARKPGSYDKRRYRPGERMLPQPTID